MKKIVKFLLILIPWFISGLIFKSNPYFYNTINKPSFAPNTTIFSIIWSILYLLISISIYRILERKKLRDIPSYTKSLLINYFSNQVFTFLFFTVKSPFIAFIDTLIILISSLFLYEESKKIDKISSYLLVPYILWNLFATILIISIYFLNL